MGNPGLQSLRSLGEKGRLDFLVLCPCQCRWAASPCADRLIGGAGAPLGVRRKKGEKNQAIGRSRGGRTTKIHALTDTECRPIAFLLTGGNVADCTAAGSLLNHLPDCRIRHADKGYDSDAIRRRVEARDTLPNIPPKANRRWRNCFWPVLYRDPQRH